MAPDPLARRLGTADAVVVGMGSMLGAGVFAAVGPAAAAGGAGLLAGLGVAAAVAYANATSSAQLAARHPESGGTYVYGRERLGPFWGWLAGWGFVVGKTASCAAMALTLGVYAAPGLARPIALAAVAGLATVNWFGVRRTALATRAILAAVLAALALVVAAALLGGEAGGSNLEPLWVGGSGGVLEAAGLLFFAFAGYARIATLGEEVIDPARTIPRAIPLALGLTLAVYATVALAGVLAVGPRRLAASETPLATAVEAGSWEALVPAVRVGGTLAAAGVLLSLLAGVSRTALAMARRRDLPPWLAAVHPRYSVPHRAEAVVATLVGITVAVADVRQAIGFSSFCVLAYYAVANASAWTLPAGERRWPRWLAAGGLAGCALLAFSLPAGSVLAGAGVMAVGAARWLLGRAGVRSRPRPGDPPVGPPRS